MGEMTLEQFRTEFATEPGRRRLGYAPDAERQDRVDRIVADDVHLGQVYGQWQRRQGKVRAFAKTERRRLWGWVGVGLLFAGLMLAVTGANLVADHEHRVSDGPCYERRMVGTQETRTVCPAHSEPTYDGYRTTWSILGWGLGGGMVATGLVLIVRHPRF